MSDRSPTLTLVAAACGWMITETTNALPVRCYRTSLVAQIRVNAPEQSEVASRMFGAILDEMYNANGSTEEPEFYIKLKMDYNDTRTHRHGGKLA